MLTDDCNNECDLKVSKPGFRVSKPGLGVSKSSLRVSKSGFNIMLYRINLEEVLLHVFAYAQLLDDLS